MNRRRNVAIAIAVLAAVAITILRSHAGQEPSEDAARRRPPDERSATVEAAYPPALPYSESLTVPPPPSLPPGTTATELCGYGKVDPEQIPPVFDALSDAAILSAVAEFEGSADPRKRALGLATQALIDAEAADRRVTAEDPTTCRETADCDERAADAFARAATPSIEALTRLAINTQDPQVYVTAMRACRSILVDSPPSLCSTLTLDGWARVDPDNAMVWLLTARDARHRKDEPGFQAALQRASHAAFFDRRLTPYGEILASIDQGSEPVRALMVAKLAAADAREDPAEYPSNFTMFIQYCAKETGAPELCRDLGRVLTEQSLDRVALEIGRSLQPAVDINGTRFPKGYAYLQLAPQVVARDPLSCNQVAKSSERLLGIARYGEMGYFKQRAAAQPR